MADLSVLVVLQQVALQMYLDKMVLLEVEILEVMEVMVPMVAQVVLVDQMVMEALELPLVEVAVVLNAKEAEATVEMVEMDK